jgi:hypothetical protein
VLSFGVGVALSPIPIIGVVLMLGTPRARTNGAIMATLCVVIAAKLIGDAISGFAA